MGILFPSLSAWSGEDYSTWKYSAKLHLNLSATGANIPRTITSFPVLVRITDSRILSQSMATGADVRFMDEKGAHLDFQIERWNPAAGKAEFWVRVPQLDSLSDKQYLTVLWGNANADWLSDGSKLFTADLGYNAVYHLGEGGTQARANSSGDFNAGTPRNYDGDERVEGVIGMADSLDGATAGDYLDLGSGFGNLNFGFTFTIWAYCTGTGYYERFLDLGNNSNADNILLAREKSANDLAAYVWNGGAVAAHVAVAGALDVRKWMQLGLTITPNAAGSATKNIAILYKNGIKIGEGTLSLPIAAVNRTNNSIGRSNWVGNDFFTGILDEAEISSHTHSAEWIKLNYESQRPDSKMFTWEFPPDIKLAIKAQPAGITVAEGKPGKFSVTAVASQAIAYQWFMNGSPVSGATSADLLIAAVSLQQAGVYSCRLTDGKDTLVSDKANLIVLEDLSTWAHSQKIFVNTTATGANLSLDVANFPLLVRLGKRTLDFKQIQSQGKDLRFSTSDGFPMSYSIERWDADTAEVWVHFNKIFHNDDKSYILMYWGKAAATAKSVPELVFTKTDGWRAYYGFNEPPVANRTVTAVDASPYAHNAAGTGVTTVADGAIGRGLAFAGDSHVEAPQVATEGLKSFTIMAWAREKKPGHGITDMENPIVFATLSGAPGQGDMGAYSREGAFGYWNGMNARQSQTATPTSLDLNNGPWHLVAITQGTAGITAYGDGIALNSAASEQVALASNVLGIGGVRDPKGTWLGGFTGDIDAVQVLAESKPADWIKLAYFTQKPGNTAVTFGAASDQTPPAPVIDPPSGEYLGPVQIQLTCATDSTRILYTLDGTTPDTVAGGSTKNIGSNMRLTASGTVKAIAYRKGKASAVASAVYLIQTAPADVGDTLKPGGGRWVDSLRRVTYPNQDSKSPVLLTLGPPWNPLPTGFDRVGPLFTVAAVDTAAAFPGLLVSGDSLTGLSLFRRDPNRLILWMPPKDGQLWIPSAGSYFWGRDIQPPRIRLAGTGALGADSMQARIVIEDNVAALQGKVRYWSGGQDSLGWWSSASGEVLEFTLPVPAKPETPLEVRFAATDQSRQAQYPANGTLTLARPLPALAAPLTLRPGYKWKMAGLPMLAEGEITLRDLAAMSGTGPLYAAVWRNPPAVDTGYLILKDKDPLPAGKGFWLASAGGVPGLNFPASRATASDSDGLFTIKLTTGWNLVTCPSFRPLAWPVSVNDGEAYLRSPLKPLHGFSDTAYTRPDSLRPWESYYVYYPADTAVRVGPGAPRVVDAFPTAKAAALGKQTKAKSLAIGFSATAGIALDLGASAFARPGLGVEDEARPPALDGPGDAWIARDGRALAVDYVAWDPSRAMAWTLAARGQPAGSAFTVAHADLPAGYEAWAVSPARRLKWRLGAGGNVPVTGDDTLRVYAGTPEALAAVSDLRNGRDAAGAFAARLRSAGGGCELILELPAAAALDVRIWSARGQNLGGFSDRPFSAGRHTLSWNALAGGRGPLSQGAYWLEIRARGSDWNLRRVQPLSFLR